MISHRPPDFPQISAAILAGGLATRMGGAAKAFLALGGEALLDRQLEVLRPRFAEVLVSVGAEGTPAGATEPFERRGLRTVRDRFPVGGPLAGLHASLEACETPWLFAVACDMPFLDGALIDRMAACTIFAEEVDVVVPMRAGRPEPLHAFYRASAAAEAKRCLEEGRRAMVDLIASIRSRPLREKDLPGLSQSYTWENLNTPGDLEAAAQALARSSGGERGGR